MNKLLEYSSRIIIWIFYILFSWIISFIKICQNKLYSNWVSCKFRSIETVFLYPVSLIVNPKLVSIGRKTKFGKMAVITIWPIISKKKPHMRIGCNCNFGDFIHLTCSNHISIGNNILTGRWVTITDNSHGNTDYETLRVPPLNRPIVSKGPVIIEDNVWIGDKVTILPNVRIGKCSVIAANAVITTDIPAFSIAAGNPAKIIKTYNYE